MKSLLTFEQFINEAIVKDDFKKVCITRRKILDDSFITGPAYKSKEYWNVITRDMESIEKFDDMPVLNYDRGTLEKFLENGMIKPYQVYNTIEARETIVSKAKFYKEHADSGYIVPTATDKNDVGKLKFPIVAKPDNEHSGLGITVFKDVDEFENADLSKFSSFSEKIDIAEEHRYFMWRDEIIQWCERVPMDDETADIAKKDPEQETNFSYILKDVKDIKDSHIKAIRYFSDAHQDLDFYAIDLAEDAKENVYVFEMNSEPGTLFGVLTIVYQKIYEDYYESPMDPSTIDLLKQYKEADSKQNTKQNPNWKVQK